MQVDWYRKYFYLVTVNKIHFCYDHVLKRCYDFDLFKKNNIALLIFLLLICTNIMIVLIL